MWKTHGVMVASESFTYSSVWRYALIFLVLLINLTAMTSARAYPTFSDNSVRIYLTERTCWWNEICKEEFQTQFKCKCPQWSFCRSPGRYYNAYCSMTGTGYIWTQPERSWSLLP
ncbi:hypothetical protein LSTR_LSTR001166 [Laodelphax striatellus]|uniref:Uncharacterized protein n=1 Tax=Laodelphax striatellus TaxID=195883 RepID=A0A482X1B4_LAOST|nr:hypothetical protein LSTR_LSTR001166 [Laodelphax striatellus]